MISQCNRAYDPDKRPSPLSERNSLSFDKLLNLINSHKLKSVDETLRYLGENYPEYLKYHTLMYDSFSIQKSSFTEPRAIVFGPKADFIFTFNGNNSSPGGNAIEAMQFNKKNNSFEFREIIFKRSNNEWLEKSDISSQNNRIQVSKKNISKCTQCHGTNAGPIWEKYFLWPGAYGSNDDLLLHQFDQDRLKNFVSPKKIHKTNKPFSQGRFVDLAKGVKDAEVLGFKKYLTIKNKHPRYKHLPMRSPEKAFLQSMKNNSTEGVNWSKYFKKEKLASDLYTWPARPNITLQTLLNNKNRKRILHDLKKNPHSQEFSPPLKWLVFCLQSKDTYIKRPRGILEKIISKEKIKKMEAKLGSFEKYEKDFLNTEFNNQIEIIERLESTFGKNSLILADSDSGGASRAGGYWHNSKSFYRKLSPKRKWDNNTFLASRAGTDQLNQLIVMTYILDFYDFDLSKYSTSLRRYPSFFDGGDGALLCIFDSLYDKNLGKDVPLNFCSDLQAKSLEKEEMPDTLPSQSD